MNNTRLISSAVCLILIILPAIASTLEGQTNAQAERHFENANELFKLAEYDAAIAEYNEVIHLSSDSRIAQNARYWIGQSQFRTGQFDAAQATFAKLIETHPASAIVPATKLMVERVEQAKETEAIRAAMNDTANEGYIIDPDTGVKYTKIATFAGKNDVIKWNSHLGLSPNGKFLLHEGIVVPLDGSEPFDLVDTFTLRGVWSPDGTKVAFYSGDAICVVPVSPQTGQATGPVRKLLEGRYRYQAPVSWSPDGRKLTFGRYDKEHSGEIWTLSVTDGSLTPGEAPGKVVIPRGHPSLRSRWRQWSSPDGRWILYEADGTHLLNVDDNRKLDITPPPQQVGSFVSWSPDSKKMLFYRGSYDYRYEVRVMSASGGPSVGLEGPAQSWPQHRWSPDSKAVLVVGYKDGRYGVWISPLSGGDPVLLEFDASVGGEFLVHEVSPTGDKLAFVVDREDGTKDLYVVPISLKDARSAGPAVKVFEGWCPRYESDLAYREASWSPDGSRLAVIHRGDVWIASSNSDKPVQLTQEAGAFYPGWSPDGTMVHYMAWPEQNPQGGLYVMPSHGGKPIEIPGGGSNSVWSPDGSKLAIVMGGAISTLHVSGIETQEMVKWKDLQKVIAILKNLALERVMCLDWSPDGKYIVCDGLREEGESSPIIVIPVDRSKPTMLATDDDSWKTAVHWSPDGKWISYRSGGPVKVRPEGTLWEAEFEEVVKSASR